MIKRSACRLAAIAAVLGAGAIAPLTTAAPAQAYCGTTIEWPGTYLYTKAGSNVPSGWIDAIKGSVSQWNNISGANWTLDYSPSSAVQFTIRYATPTGGFGGAPGLTVIETLGSSVNGGDVYLNPNWTWNLVGNLNQANQVADVRTVTVHELGHELVLVHPSQCGTMTDAERASAMNPNFTKKWSINSDDRAGAAFMK